MCDSTAAHDASKLQSSNLLALGSTALFIGAVESDHYCPHCVPSYRQKLGNPMANETSLL